MPPATPKLAFAPDGVPVIQPPPVRKSEQLDGDGGGGDEPGGGTVVLPPQVTPANAELITRSAAPSMITCSALIVMSAESAVCTAVCSLMIKWPFERQIGWFASPDTLIACPFTTSPAIWELPPSDGELQQAAMAQATSASAAIKFPPTFTLRRPAEASEEATLCCPMVVAWPTSNETSSQTSTVNSDDWSAPPELGNGPVSHTLTGMPRTLPDATLASPR